MRPLGSSQAWHAGPVTPRATAVLAPNPGLMTLDGTNTWLLAEPGADRGIVVDPGPDDPGHCDAVLAEAHSRGVRVTTILLTHGHADHSGGAAALSAATAAPVRALDPQHRLGGEGLHDGDVISVRGLEVAVVATPGHTRDSLTFHVAADAALLTGDTVLGRGSAVIAHPDGHLGAYLDSLHRLSTVVEEHGSRWVLPGHGPACSDPGNLLAAYIDHRQQRLAAVRAARDSGVTDVEALLDVVYSDVPDHLRWAARMSLAAQLDHVTGQADHTNEH